MIIIKTIILLEDASGISSVTENANRHSGECIYISLSPTASYAFEKHKIKYKTIQDYDEGDERYNAGQENFQRIDRMVTILDAEISHIHAIPTLTPARFSIYNLKILLDVLWNTIGNLKAVIDAEKPDTVFLYTSYPAEAGSDDYAFSNNESVYAEVLGMKGWNIPVTIVRNHPDLPEYLDERRPTTSSGMFNWLKQQDFLFNLALIRKNNGMGTAVKTLFDYLVRRHQKPVLIYNSGYNWNDALGELYAAGICPVYRISDTAFARDESWDSANRLEVQKICNSNRSMREFSNILGIEAGDFLFMRISRIAGNAIQESILAYRKTRLLIKEKKIRCLLHTVRERAAGHAIIQAARDEGVCVVSWQHGGAGYCYHPMMLFIECINSDWHFVFGDGAAESYRGTAEKFGLNHIPVFFPAGSSSLDNFCISLKKSLVPTEDKRIVFISTNYLPNNYFVSQPCDLSVWNEQIWLLQKQFMDLAITHPEKRFIIKLHPFHKDQEPLKSYVEDKGIANLQIITSETGIRDLIDTADFIIFDLISTGILQVLTSDLPVFVYSGLHTIDPEPVRLLKKRAYVYDESSELIRKIDGYIRTRGVEDQTVDTRNHEFLKRYGTDILSHNSAKRATAKIEEILTEMRKL